MYLYVTDLPREKWKPIADFDSPSYMASNMGRIMSMGRNGGTKKMILPGTPDKNGYLRLSLAKNKKQKFKKIHQLVLRTFKGGPPSDNMEVNHKNGIKTDNRLSNLEWNTSSQNKEHAYNTGLRKAPREGQSALARKVIQILDGQVVKEYESLSSTVRDGFTVYGVCKAIRKGQNHRGFKWKHVDEKAA